MMPSIAGQSTAFTCDAVHLEHLLETLDVLPGFFQVRQKALLQLRIGRLIRHFRQRLGELLLGVIDVLQLMHEQVVHGLDVFVNSPIDPILSGFGEHGGIGLHEKPQNSAMFDC